MVRTRRDGAGWPSQRDSVRLHSFDMAQQRIQKQQPHRTELERITFPCSDARTFLPCWLHRGPSASHDRGAHNQLPGPADWIEGGSMSSNKLRLSPELKGQRLSVVRAQDQNRGEVEIVQHGNQDS